MRGSESGSREYLPIARRYLRLADRLLPDRVVGFYVVGSAALGAFRPGYSDLDFTAVVDRTLSPAEIARLRLLHGVSAAVSSVSAMRRGFSPLSETCNGVFVAASELTKPVLEIAPIASHTGELFSVGKGFDVNPVVWTVLEEKGVALRGPGPGELGLRGASEALQKWNRQNLESYWRPWAQQILSSPPLQVRLRARWWTTWGVLGPPRLHHTIATGEVISKEEAGHYALATFDREWHPIVEDGLAFRANRELDPTLGSRAARLTRAAEFVLHVAEASRRL